MGTLRIRDHPSLRALVSALRPQLSRPRRDDEGTLPSRAQLRQCKYLNNLIEQDLRFIKRRVNPGLGFSSFNTARRTIRGYESMNMIRKGQIAGIDRREIQMQVKFVSNLFGIAA